MALGDLTCNFSCFTLLAKCSVITLGPRQTSVKTVQAPESKNADEDTENRLVGESHNNRAPGTKSRISLPTIIVPCPAQPQNGRSFKSENKQPRFNLSGDVTLPVPLYQDGSLKRTMKFNISTSWLISWWYLGDTLQVTKWYPMYPQAVLTKSREDYCLVSPSSLIVKLIVSLNCKGKLRSPGLIAAMAALGRQSAFFRRSVWPQFSFDFCFTFLASSFKCILLAFLHVLDDFRVHCVSSWILGMCHEVLSVEWNRQWASHPSSSWYSHNCSPPFASRRVQERHVCFLGFFGDFKRVLSSCCEVHDSCILGMCRGDLSIEWNRQWDLHPLSIRCSHSFLPSYFKFLLRFLGFVGVFERF